jgi:hypothetical protein
VDKNGRSGIEESERGGCPTVMKMDLRRADPQTVYSYIGLLNTTMAGKAVVLRPEQELRHLSLATYQA